MMMRILTNKILTTISFLLIYAGAFSQGLVENELSANQALILKYEETRSFLKLPSMNDTLILGPKGLLDDFSAEGPYPDTSLWLDNKVYINRGFAKAPVTIGTATFDGLDYTGLPYDFTASSTSSAIADYLSSKPVNLNYPVSDSIYLSFYYQPQGRGNAPEAADSLVLQFKGPGVTSSYTKVWSKKGSTLSVNDSSWKLVMIPITDTAYLKNGFQFRFYNRATLSGNTDHWHIDYVYLNRIRTKIDTSFEDVSFVYNTPSLINTYTAMPWKQYDTTYMKDDYSTVIRNNHTVTKNGNFIYKIYDNTGAQVNTTYSGGSFNIDPFVTFGYMNYVPFTAPPVNYTIPLLTGPVDYSIESIVTSTPDNNRGNDTVKRIQELSNYFSYDDGTAENSFGMSTLSAQLAEKFVLNVADSLQYIDIYFNPFLTNTAVYSFTLKVWGDAGGVPGGVLYTGTPVNPAYSGIAHNQFIRYPLNAPLYMSPGTFYAGFIQHTDQFLNVGVDKNTNTQANIFYNVTGSWNNSPFTGSLMLHPVFGASADFTGSIATSELKNNVTLFPNPAHDELYIRINNGSESGRVTYSIMDPLGRVIIENVPYSDKIDISELKSGIYFIRISDGKNTSSSKFIKTN
jgi:hypothetical protein